MDGYDLSNVVVTQGGVEVNYKLSADKTAISFITVETSPSIIKGLRAGRYKLEETVTPEAYLTADAIIFNLLSDGSTDCNGDVRVAGSPIIMVDQADPTYHTDGNGDESGSEKKPSPKPIPATGEEINFGIVSIAVVFILAAVFLSGYSAYRIKRRKG